MLLMFLGHVKRLLNHAKRTMSLATTDPFATSPGPEATAARHRRAATQRVREVRDRLTSTSGTRPAFDYELLRQYAQNRLSGSLGVILLAIAIGFITSFRASVTWAGMWVAIVLTVQSFIVSASASGPVPPDRLRTELGLILDGYLRPCAD